MKRKLRFEGLEDRSLLAGNVTADFSGGVLTLTGDDLANSVNINGSGAVTLTGVGTTINGRTTAHFSGVEHLRFNMNGGADVLQIGNTGNTQFKTVAGTTGNGADRVTFGGAGPNRTNVVSIDMGAGNDTFAATRGNFGVISLNMEDGNNTVNVANVVARNGVAIVAGNGNDTLTLTNDNLASALSINLGNGTNNATLNTVAARSDIALVTGSGADTIAMTTVRSGGSVVVNSGAGNDTVRASGITAAGVAVFVLSEGDNTLDVTNLTANTGIRVVGGSGVDQVTATNVTAHDAVVVNLADGDDSLAVSGGNYTDADLVLIGGPGQDNLSLAFPSQPKSQRVVQFETFAQPT